VYRRRFADYDGTNVQYQNIFSGEPVFKLFRRMLSGKKPVAEEKNRRPYHAVSIHYDRRQACPAVRDRHNQVFFPNEAPPLPLHECTRRVTCRCRYEHLPDRRRDMRRDTDHGLPERLFDAQDRRRGLPDRRRRVA
jgi:hypothetical protein